MKKANRRIQMLAAAGLSAILSVSGGLGQMTRVCHFLKHIETKISLFCKVFLAFFMLLLYNIFVGTTVFSRRVSCLLKPFRIMGKNI